MARHFTAATGAAPVASADSCKPHPGLQCAPTPCRQRPERSADPLAAMASRSGSSLPARGPPARPPCANTDRRLTRRGPRARSMGLRPGLTTLFARVGAAFSIAPWGSKRPPMRSRLLWGSATRRIDRFGCGLGRREAMRTFSGWLRRRLAGFGLRSMTRRRWRRLAMALCAAALGWIALGSPQAWASGSASYFRALTGHPSPRDATWRSRSRCPPGRS